MGMRKWASGLCVTLLLANLGTVYAADTSDLLRKQTAYNQNTENAATAKEYAVALAQDGQFSASLEIFKQLVQRYPTEPAILFDYITVLNWSGNNRSAIELFETLKVSSVPDYVKSSAAGAYYQMGDYKAAQKLFHEAAANGNHKAVIGDAQSLIRMGNAAGYAIYDKLLTQNPDDLEVYLSRASMRMLGREYAPAIADFQRAASLVKPGAEGIAQKRQIDYQLAISHIRSGDQGRAVLLLKPYIQDKTADVWMQSDYLLALRLNSDYKAAIAEGERLWPDYGKVPVFGLQALADSYLRNGQFQPAEKCYQHIIQREPNSTDAQLGLAYSRVAQGKTGQGLAYYRQALDAKPQLAAVVLDDAYALIGQGRYAAGQAVYGLVLERFPDVPVFRQELATVLVDHGMPRQAYEQFDYLAKLPGGEIAGNAGRVQTAASVGDYRAAGAAAGILREKYSRNAVAQAALADFENRRRGGLYAGFTHSDNYKGIDSNEVWIAAEQNIGGSYSVLAALGSNHIMDKPAGESATLRNQSVGLRYTGIRYEGEMWLDNYQNNGSFTSYRISNRYYWDDRTHLNVNFGKSPVLDVQALDPGNIEGFGRIMSKYYAVAFQRAIGAKDSFTFDVSREFYSDGNRVNGYGLRWDHILLSKEKKSLDWFVYGKRSNFKYQQINGVDTVYESPTVRQAYGTGVTEKWVIPEGYWQATTGLEWGRDRPDPNDFSPFFRLEYGHDFSADHAFLIGAEYGARTNHLYDESGLHFGYHQYDIRYRAAW
ncbi:MAG: Tetratricopeptide repeat-containing protein [Firmicutes bacterium]|nr:Tetratricopeptide repeat-containing protein [Bacillota bacterium]